MSNTADFRGKVAPSANLKSLGIANEANIVLSEFNNNFYFSLTANRLEQWGYSSADGSAREIYSQPFVKMAYPFEYGDQLAGDFAGELLYGQSALTFTGNYSVEADGYGELRLPGNILIPNALRLKTIKTYYRNYPGGATDVVEATTMRWYSADIRFPLLVLTKITLISGQQNSETYQAAYRTDFTPERVATIETAAVNGLVVSPNPFGSQLKVDYTLDTPGRVTIALYDQSGRLAEVLESREAEAGDYSKTYSPESALSQGVYYLHITSGNRGAVTKLEHVK